MATKQSKTAYRKGEENVQKTSSQAIVLEEPEDIQIKPIAQDILNVALVHAIRGHNNWSRPSREEARAAIESLPSRYCQDLDRTDCSLDEITDIEGEELPQAELTADPADVLHLDVGKGNRLNGYLKTNYHRTMIKISNDAANYVVLSVIAKLKGVPDDHSVVYLRGSMVVHFCNNVAKFANSKLFKATVVTQRRSPRQWAVAMTSPHRMRDQVALTVIKDMVNTPIVIVLPGAEPGGRTVHTTMVESGHEILINKPDFTNIPKHLAPIVIAYNGRDNFVPTICLNQPEIAQWNLDCISRFSQASLTIINELDRESITEMAQTQLDQLEHVLLESINIFSSTSTARSARAATRRSKRKVPVSSIINHPGARNVTGKAGASTKPGVPHGSHSVPTVSSPVASCSGEESPPVAPAKQKKKRREKRHQCSTCGKIFTRKSDHESHIVVEHDTGYHCIIHNKSFKHKKGYKEHLTRIHDKKFNYHCDKCEFQTNGKQLLEQHKEKAAKK